MKIRLAVSEKRRQEIEEALTACGIEIDEDSDLTLSESGKSPGRLLVRDAASGERVPPAGRRHRVYRGIWARDGGTHAAAELPA